MNRCSSHRIVHRLPRHWFGNSIASFSRSSGEFLTVIRKNFWFLSNSFIDRPKTIAALRYDFIGHYRGVIAMYQVSTN